MKRTTPPQAAGWSRWWPLAVFLVGAIVSGAGAIWLARSTDAQATADFERMVAREAQEISRRFRQPTYGLAGARGVYATHAQVSRDLFRRYVATRSLEVEFPGVRGFGFIERVMQPDLPAFIARERADGAPDFTLRQLEKQDEPDLFVIKFIEPAERNLGAQGLDVGSEAVRRRGVTDALARGEATTSGMITLVQDQRRSPGVLMYMPIFGDPTPEMAAVGERGPLRGFVYSPIVIAELLRDLGDVMSGQARVELFDTPSGTATGELMFDSARVDDVSPPPTKGRAPRFEMLQVIDVPGRLLTLRVRSTPAFEAGYAQHWAGLFGLGGLLASLMLAGLLRQQITGRGRAEALAQAMTADLQRLAVVARRTNNAVVITDVQRRITWVNEGFERVSGYSAAEALGQSPGALLQAANTDAATVAALREALNACQPFQGEILNRAKDGRHYWLALDIQPLYGDDGSHQGFMAMESDITDRKNAERGLARQRQSLQNIIEGTQVGTWEWNVETGETVFNERWAQIVGYTLAELSPTSIDTWTRFTHPDDLRASSIALERHFDGLTPSYECEARMRHRDGHWVWVLDRGKLFSRSDDGRPRWMAGTHMDITERKQAEAALRTSQSFLTRTGRIGGVGGWELDFSNRQLAWTEETCRIHARPIGHRPTLKEATDYFAPDSRPVIVAAAQRLEACGEGFDLELQIVRADGQTIWVRIIGEAEVVDGKPVRLIGALQDITARRALEAEVKRQGDLLRGAIDALDEAFVLFDPDDRLVLCNERYRMLYSGVADLIKPGVSFETLVRTGAERGDYAQAIGRVDAWVTERVAAHRAADSTVIQPLADGRTLRIVERKLADGHIVGFRIDITELMRATERAEAASNEARRALLRLQAIYDILPVGITITDRQGHIIDCNPASERLLGISKAEHLARTYDDAQWSILREDGTAMPPEEFASVRALGGGAPVHDMVMNVVTPQRSVWLSVSAMPVQHEDLGVVVGYVDITEQRAQRQALEEAKALAEQASVTKSQFLANMSHEIRTPMNAILGMLRLLRRTELAPRQADYASKTEGAARSLLGLLNDILDFSKVEAGKMTLDPHPFALDQLMRDLGVILSANVGAKPVEVLFDIDPALPRRLVGDAMRLQQVLINLGGNAVKFTAEGEVVVSVRQVQRLDDTVTLRVAVRDTGIGIAPENQARIFTGFSQAEASTTRRFGGTGLGVSISQRLVGLMGGELQLDSALGSGSTFHFCLTLPVAAASGDDTPTFTASDPSALRVLVVDDNPTARHLLQGMTQTLGWTADVADSGQAALDMLEQHRVTGGRYDAVFVDWQMPGLDGWQTAQRIRSDGLAAETPLVVMVTANGREKLEQRSSDEQRLLDGFLVKPVTVSMLFDAISDARQGRDQPHLSRVGHATGEPRLVGLRLLVAEDNANNQQVARELLEDEGALVQIANNGQEAVEAVAAADPPFDVVLMDLQMPVMDGFSATARIRQDLGRDALPIVAMTANAMASDREACLAAGMNEHVGKPFDIDQLVGVLRRISGRGTAAPAAAMATPAAELAPAVLEAASRAGLDLPAALRRLGGKLPVFRRMLRDFTDELQRWPQTLQQQQEAGAVDDVVRSLHTLKGLAATVGIGALSATAAAAEKAVNMQPTPEVMVEQVHAVGAAVAAAQPALAALMALLPAPAEAATAADPALLQQALRKLKALLDDSDMGATEVMVGLQAQAGADLGPQWNELGDAVAALDFGRAASLCELLLDGTTT